MIKGGVDLLQPLYDPSTNRLETLVVVYDGFIKNVSEGVLRTMLRDIDIWKIRYPLITQYEFSDQNELYENTLLFSPVNFLKIMCESILSEEEIEKDLSKIIPNIFINLQSVTSFEYALLNTLKETFVQKCYIIKDGKFYPNELKYLETIYGESISKIEFYESSVYPFIKLKETTSIFVTDTKLLFDSIAACTDDELKGKLIILQNNSTNLKYNVKENIFEYLYTDIITELNSKELYGISRMYNHAITDESDILDDDGELITEPLM